MNLKKCYATLKGVNSKGVGLMNSMPDKELLDNYVSP